MATMNQFQALGT